MRFIVLVFILILTACATDTDRDTDDQMTALPAITPTAIAAAQPSPIPTGASNADAQNMLTLWWPDVLAPGERPEVNIVLNQHINGFAEAENVEFDFRLKQYSADTGSLMPTLSAAHRVAPGAFPHVTLIRHSDLAAAVEAGIIFPLDGLVSAATIGELYDAALQLGQVDGVLYGFPFLLDVNHLAHQVERTSSAWTFEDVLTNDVRWAFPAGRTSTLNYTVYAQYIAAGGDPPEADGNIVLDVEAFLTVLQFYEDAQAADVVNQVVLDYSNLTDYVTRFATGDLDAALMPSTAYLDERFDGQDWLAASLPTVDGRPIGVLDGWMWVITASNADQQALAARFINWMMAADGQRSFAEVIHMLPSQSSVLQRLDDDLFMVDFYDTLLQAAIPPPPVTFNTAAARAMQNTFISVLNGNSTAEDAITTLQMILDQP
jgi:ABC-type glycerol-3-phosphate transport system substrate-binding protein